MLNVGKLAAGPGAARYYVDRVAQGHEDYYSGEGESPGVWQGGGAAMLGLSGEVSEQGIVRLLEGRDPATGELLGRPVTGDAVAGFDLTFRTPKSVGILFGIAEPAVTRAIVAAHEAAVAEAMAYMEREACRARRGQGGAIVVKGHGFIAAAFRHRASRAGDPLLHTHVVVANATRADDADHRGRGGPVSGVQGPRERAVGGVDQQDDHPPRDILAVAEERDLVARNPVRVNTRNRKLKTKRRRPVYLDSAEQIAAMIEAAGTLDADPGARTAGRRALIATLIYVGLRIGEATALTWGDVDLANGRISVRDSKTEASERLVDILPALRDELATHRHAAGHADTGTLVFPTSSGSRRDKDNARERVIRPVVAAAEELLAARGRPPLPAGVTAHKLRHTFASILYVRGEDPPYVMSQLGHTDAGFTLRVYAHTMRRDEADKERLKALVEGRIGHHWAPSPRFRPPSTPWRSPLKTTEAPQMQGFLTMGAAGFEPATSRV